MTTLQRCRVPPGTAERVDDTPQAERGRPCRAVSRTKRPRNRACSPVLLRGTRRVARRAQRASQCVLVLPGLQASWRVQTRRGGAMATMHDREDRPMAHKGRGIFLVYVDIPTVCLYVTSLVVSSYGYDDGKNGPTRCAVIDGARGDR